MFEVTFDKYTLTVDNKFSSIYDEYHKRATLVEVFPYETEQSLCVITLSQGNNWPFLVIVQGYEDYDNQFHPGILLIPETSLLFIGAGTRLLTYTWDPPRKLWEETVIGFWRWERYGQFVIMSAELDFFVGDIFGKKLWSTFVEPPWEYRIVDEIIYLNIMGKETAFSLMDGKVLSD
jgi:hypothetical protein